MGSLSDQNLRGQVILAICTFFKALVYLNISLNSELAKECTKMLEGKIIALER